jgi:hypothetical protein
MKRYEGSLPKKVHARVVAIHHIDVEVSGLAELQGL